MIQSQLQPSPDSNDRMLTKYPKQENQPGMMSRAAQHSVGKEVWNLPAPCRPHSPEDPPPDCKGTTQGLKSSASIPLLNHGEGSLQTEVDGISENCSTNRAGQAGPVHTRLQLSNQPPLQVTGDR